MTEAVVGVLGGMGPEATLELMRRVLETTPAADDADHIRMLVDNNPKVPSRIKALLEGGGADPAPILARMARGLETAGADLLVMPCNTAHHYWPAIAAAVTIPVWHLVDLTLEHVRAHVPQAGATVGLLASPALRRIALYEPWCERHGLQLAYPQEEETLLTIIRAVKRGIHTDREVEQLNTIGRRLVDTAGADT